MGKKYEQWRKELTEAVEPQDLETFKAFINKWTALGYYDKTITGRMPDEVAEITIRKMALQLRDITPETKQKATAWLLERGYDLDIT